MTVSFKPIEKSFNNDTDRIKAYANLNVGLEEGLTVKTKKYIRIGWGIVVIFITPNYMLFIGQ